MASRTRNHEPLEETALPIPRDLLTDPIPGNRVANLAREAALNPMMLGTQGNNPLKITLGKMICWRAAAFIAWLARGIHLNPPLQTPTDAQVNAYLLSNLNEFDVVSNNNFQRLFPNWQQLIVPGPARVATLPNGSFIGFIQALPAANNAPAPAPTLRHVMLHTTLGTAAGTNNTGIFLNAGGNWSLVPLATFFQVRDYSHDHTQMVCAPVTGQTI
jgi:hypothetical protein